VKTSLDACESKESNELDKSIPSHLKVLRKIDICAFALLIFWKVSEKIKKLIHLIPFSFFHPLFALRRPPEYPRTPRAQQK